MKRVLETAWENAEKRELGGVLRGIGYGSIIMLGVTQIIGEISIVLLPVALIVLFAGMLLQSIIQRQTHTETEEQHDDHVKTGRETECAGWTVRSHIEAELGLEAVEDRYGDDWYGENPAWHEEQLSTHTKQE